MALTDLEDYDLRMDELDRLGDGLGTVLSLGWALDVEPRFRAFPTLTVERIA